MRIQHNIMAMNAYRNYSNNVSAMQKNLEKLSSGYKINRAGDDAAGLAISEKMRAQISGLEAAQKNAKDGISLVQTAEGALTEVHDMLNRMVTLATQSANGTYADDTDREQLQKEINQLTDEINRIADSSNFNGIKLLDGKLSMDGSTVDGSDRIIGDVYDAAKDGMTAVDFTGVKTVLDSPVGSDKAQTKFSVNFTGLKVSENAADETQAPTTAGSIAAAESSVTNAAATIGSAGTIAAKTGGATAEDTVTAASDTTALAKLVESMDAKDLAALDGTQDWDVKLKYDSTGDKWELSVSDGTTEKTVGEVTAEWVDDSANGALKVSDKDGNELFTLAAGGGTTTDATAFQTSYGTAAITGMQYTSAAGGLTIGSADLNPVYKSTEDLSTALAGTADIATGAVTVQYNATDDKWDITGDSASESVKATGSFANGVLTLSDAEGTELMTITVGDAASLADVKTAYTAAAVTTDLTYTAAVSAGSPTGIGDTVSYAATDDLTKALEAAAGNGGIADASQISVQWNATDEKWEIAAGGTTIKATGEFDFNTGTLTLKNENGKELMTITGEQGVATEALMKDNAAFGTSTNTNLVYSKAAAAPGAPATPPATNPGTVKVNFKMEGTDLAADVEINVPAGEDVEATDIATAVYDKLMEGADANGNIQFNGSEYKVSNNAGVLTFELTSDLNETNRTGNFDWDVSIDGGKFKGNHTAGTTAVTPGAYDPASEVANTVFRIDADDIVDGAKITVDGQTVTLAVGKDSKQDTSKAGVVNLKDMEAGKGVNLDLALSRISEKLGDGENFIIGVNNKGNADVQKGLTVHKKIDSKNTYDTKEKLAEVFSIEKPGTGKGLTLQIGDTAESFNQLTVSIKDMHAKSLGLDDIDISTQEGAQKALDKIKAAINQVSDVRGTLGATQNRLDHTINNLSVMTENIQDAESTIRDVDVAEEMMAYTKNSILIQSAQAMLAQANQVPQGVLQLLG